jgi:hypothetical protein
MGTVLGLEAWKQSWPAKLCRRTRENFGTPEKEKEANVGENRGGPQTNCVGWDLNVRGCDDTV